jgi:hypothetical protein
MLDEVLAKIRLGEPQQTLGRGVDKNRPLLLVQNKDTLAQALQDQFVFVQRLGHNR